MLLWAETVRGGALAVICRDEAGAYLGASAITFEDLVDPEILEAMACLEALSLAVDLGCQRFVVDTDCMATITHLKGEYKGPSAVTIQDIKQKMQLITSMRSGR